MLHGVLVVGFYHGFSDISAIRSLFTSNTQYGSVAGFPFEILGLVALLILFMLAATSHDFWLKKLSAPVWKSLHMLVYLSWAAAVLHVALGALQSERNVLYTVAVAAGVVTIGLLHLASGRREVRRDAAAAPPAEWMDVGRPEDIADGRAAVVCVRGGERVAVFRHRDRLSAVSNICAHQGGPLGEGRIIDGCITCPWHSYQYRPADGRAPPPFMDRICTYRLKVCAGRVLLHPAPLPPGTPVEPEIIESAGAGTTESCVHV
jgi:nitrite reductase/ring-hydroxylating ferredoxin subunit